MSPVPRSSRLPAVQVTLGVLPPVAGDAAPVAGANVAERLPARPRAVGAGGGPFALESRRRDAPGEPVRELEDVFYGSAFQIPAFQIPAFQIPAFQILP